MKKIKKYRFLNVHVPVFNDIEAVNIESACNLFAHNHECGYEYKLDSPTIGNIKLFTNGKETGNYFVCEVE